MSGDLVELEAAERRFSAVTHELVEMSHAGRQDLQLARDWLHANHAFHDVIYAAAESPLIERMAKAARGRSSRSGWATGPTSTSSSPRTTTSTARSARRSRPAARRVRASAHEHVLSGRLLEAILDKVSSQTRETCLAPRRAAA